MRLTDPRTTVLLEIAGNALDAVVALQAPAFGQDRAARAASVSAIESMVQRLRKARRPSPKPPLPATRLVMQLVDLTGRRFAVQREKVAGLIRAFADALDAQPRHAPELVRTHITSIAGEEAEPIVRDADEAWRAFHAGGFKACMVMAGAALEGVLQAAVERVGKPTATAFGSVFPARSAPSRSDDYGVEDALAVLKHLGVLTSAVSHVARGIKEMRNFVHPAVHRRQRGRVTDTQALLALQALAAVVEELAERLQLD